MSSDYRLLCLTHDPALEIGDDRWHSPQEPLSAVARRDVDELTAAHEGCDLLIGRYSYPLVEVCCPPQLGPRAPTGHLHRDPKWIDAAWLRLAWHAGTDPHGFASTAGQAARNLPACWAIARIDRLRYVLGVAEAPAGAGGASCCAACDKAGQPAPDAPSRIVMPTPAELGMQ